MTPRPAGEGAIEETAGDPPISSLSKSQQRAAAVSPSGPEPLTVGPKGLGQEREAAFEPPDDPPVTSSLSKSQPIGTVSAQAGSEPPKIGAVGSPGRIKLPSSSMMRTVLQAIRHRSLSASSLIPMRSLRWFRALLSIW